MLKKLGINPEEVSHSLAEFAVVKAFLLKNFRGRGGERGGGWGEAASQKREYIQTPSVWSFSGIVFLACPLPGYEDQDYLA